MNNLKSNLNEEQIWSPNIFYGWKVFSDGNTSSIDRFWVGFDLFFPVDEWSYFGGGFGRHRWWIYHQNSDPHWLFLFSLIHFSLYSAYLSFIFSLPFLITLSLFLFLISVYSLYLCVVFSFISLTMFPFSDLLISISFLYVFTSISFISVGILCVLVLIESWGWECCYIYLVSVYLFLCM